MSDGKELFFDEIKELRREMNNGFEKVCVALEKHKDKTDERFKENEDQIKVLNRYKDYTVGGIKLISIFAGILLFIKKLVL
jgi:hypothetical protein